MATNKTLKENYAEGNILFLMLHLPLNCIHRLFLALQHLLYTAMQKGGEAYIGSPSKHFYLVENLPL
jgi:hypothetical protein